MITWSSTVPMSLPFSTVSRRILLARRTSASALKVRQCKVKSINKAVVSESYTTYLMKNLNYLTDSRYCQVHDRVPATSLSAYSKLMHAMVWWQRRKWWAEFCKRWSSTAFIINNFKTSVKKKALKLSSYWSNCISNLDEQFNLRNMIKMLYTVHIIVISSSREND